jgi:hypothetical protein
MTTRVCYAESKICSSRTLRTAHSDQFDRYGIGLASFYPGRLTVLVNAKPFEPYSHNLREKVDKRVRRSRSKALASLSVLV